MKRIVWILLLAGGSLWAGGAGAASEKFSTGSDWTDSMSVREKYMSLLPPSMLFEDYDVHLRQSLPEYIPIIDRVMALNPQLRSEEVSNIFASTVFLFEPENRVALNTMETDFLKGEYRPRTLRLKLDEELGTDSLSPTS